MSRTAAGVIAPWRWNSTNAAALRFVFVGGAFRGWTEDFQRFFIGLELDNSKSYFEANRKLYLDRVKAPLEALFADLEPEFGKGKITRPNRDIRFSNDKSPYKTRIYGTAERGGYVGLDAKGLSAGAGHYELDPDQLDAYRKAIVADGSGSKLLAIVHRLEASGYEIGGEELKRTPAGLHADHPRARLLRHKRLYTWRSFGLQPWLGTAKAKDRVADVWRDAGPLLEWTGKLLG
jgi:uncharacterized protein (TIGR02453 family)